MSFRDQTELALGACLTAFGETVAYTPEGGSAVSITGIFNEKVQTVDASGMLVLTNRPNLGVRLSDLDDPPDVGDSVTIRTVAYKVTDIEEDGEGGATLYLHKAT